MSLSSSSSATTSATMWIVYKIKIVAILKVEIRNVHIMAFDCHYVYIL